MNILRIKNSTLLSVAALLLACLAGIRANAEDDLMTEAGGYLKDHSDRSADSSWEQAFHRRANDAMKENESISDESRYADDKVLDFFADRKKHFEDADADPLPGKDRIEVARWYVLYSKNGWRFPSKIAIHLTKENYTRYMASQ